MYCDNENYLELKYLRGRNGLLRRSKSPKSDMPGDRNPRFSLELARLLINRNGVQNYLDLLNSPDFNDSTSPTPADEKSASETITDLLVHQQSNLRQHSDRITRKKDVRNILRQIEESMLANMNPVNETQERLSLSQELRAPRNPRYRRHGEWKKSITVVLGDNTARTIPFNEPALLAFEILMQLEKVLSKEEFASFSLPINVSQLTLRRNGRHLGSMDEVKDGDVIYVTAKTSSDDEKEGFSNYNILKKVTRYPRMETALDQLRIFDEISSPSSTLANAGTSPRSLECPPRPIHIDIRLSDEEDELKESQQRLESDISLLSDEIFQPEKDDKAQIEDYRKKNKRLEQKVWALENHLNRERDDILRFQAGNKKLKSEKRLLLQELHRVEQKVKTMSKYKSELEHRMQHLERRLESEIKGTSKFTGIELPKQEPETPAELESAIKSFQEIITNLRGKLIDEYKSQIVCSICIDKPRDRVLIPCGHCFCESCAARFEICPNCRKKVKNLQRIY